MSTDLIQRLRFLASGQDDAHSKALTEAANALEAQRRQLSAAKVLIESSNRVRAHISQQHSALMHRAADVQGERDANAILTEQVERLEAEVEKLRRGECICTRCGLRQPGESAGPVPF